MYALNALTVFVMLCMAVLALGVIADNWPSRQRVEKWLEARFDAALKVDSDAILTWHLRMDRFLRFVRIANPRPDVCEDCGTVWDASRMTIHNGQFSICPDCEEESAYRREMLRAAREIRAQRSTSVRIRGTK